MQNLKRTVYNLSSLSREELIALVKEKCPEFIDFPESCEGKTGKKEKLSCSRVFDPSSYESRMVALKVSYFGLKYQGFASQVGLVNLSNNSGIPSGGSANTVEDHLFRALIRTRLILDPKTCNYSRCGRTDSGVSATGQVIALRMRTSNKKICENESAMTTIDYCSVLNKQLPEDIRVLDWAFVADSFSARFSCSSRIYHYYFCTKHYDNSTRKIYNLDVVKMQSAARLLVGVHDYRNFCKRDPSKPNQSFTREIIDCLIEEVPNSESLFRFVCMGSAFLYHQIRCIMSVLFMIGSGIESVDLINAMLTKTVPVLPGPAGPLIHYDIASEIPLTLYECKYEKLNSQPIEWKNTQKEGQMNTKTIMLSSHFHRLWEAKQCEAFICKGLLDAFPSVSHSVECNGVIYRKLLENSKQ